ncbi:anti-sigma factor family protein [Pseudomonas abieticivorans]|uniref:anti-sigma factor family protein n=1 Tax=Pseudomonas abieticivorans TaxID=2931382 RepID=UPI0020BF0343|nr:anti-sigma factor [Pseudomonas sp. PIA16]
MITLPPRDADLHAYVDHQLDTQDRLRLEAWLASHPQDAAKVHAWKQDAQYLRATLGASQPLEDNPALDLHTLRRQLRQRSRRHLASAAALLLAIGVGGLSGWQAREMTQHSAIAPMTDALQAYRAFAVDGILPADFKVGQNDDMQHWLDRYFTDARRLPNLQGAGFTPVSGRLLTTDQGPAAMVLYEDAQGRRISFYVRPPGPNNLLLPQGSRRDGDLQADYWSGPGYNYAMVAPADIAQHSLQGL